MCALVQKAGPTIGCMTQSASARSVTGSMGSAAARRRVRAAAVHPGGIQTELGRHIDQAHIQKIVEDLSRELAAEGKPPFQFKTIPQGAATSVWAGVVAPAVAIGGRYCENCHVGEIVPDDRKISAVSEGVRAYALDPARAEALWAASEAWVGERF